MIKKINISDNTKSPILYLSNIGAFKNGCSYEFKPGVNVVVGPNGSGKSTLFKLIEYYLMIGDKCCEKGEYGSNVTRLRFPGRYIDGVDVFADYNKNTFKLSHYQDQKDKDVVKDINSFATHFESAHSSQGEKVMIAINSLFNYIFSNKVALKFNYSQFKESFPEYYNYTEKHKIEDNPSEYTILMDEPDRNLDIENIKIIKNILSFHKESTQLIVTLHNPLLITWAKKQKHINLIELKRGYARSVENIVKQLI